MRVGILACSKSKLPHPAPARDLYTGQIFRWSAEVLRRRGCDRLVILSARYGAIPEGRVVAPYDLALATLRRGEREAWARRAGLGLRDLVPPSAEVVAIVPAPYWAAFEQAQLPTVTRLHAGLPIGRLRAALLTELREAPRG